MTEWKEIEMTGGRYSCSSEGLIRSNKSGKVLGGTLSPDGYRQIGMMMPSGKQRSFMWHRVVAMTWHPSSEFESAQVDHLDKNKLNNHPSNLQWVTPEENIRRRDTSFVTVISPSGEELKVVIITDGEVDLSGWTIK